MVAANTALDLYDLQPEERDVLVPQESLTVSQWAEAFRRLSKKTSDIEGPWSNSYCPHMVEIMDTLSDTVTRETWVQKSVQSAGTEGGLNFIGHTIDRDPAPTLLVMPDENEVKKQLRMRIKPMFESTPQLLKHLPGRDIRKLNIGQETELDNMFLSIAWAGSAAALASTPICKIILDEAAKYQEEVGEEAGSYDLARDRLTTFFYRSKLYAPSTPRTKGDMFDLEYNNTDMAERWVRCRFCKQYHIPKWAYVILDKDSVGGLLAHKDYMSGECARYVCPLCEKKWTEQDRWRAACDAKWIPWDGKIVDGKVSGPKHRSTHRGFRITSFIVYPKFMTVSRLAGEWARAQVSLRAGKIGPLKNFINSRLAESFEIKEKQTDEKTLILHKGNYKTETIPLGVQMLTCGVDVQLDHIWYSVLGWGYLSECWSIVEGRLETGDTQELKNFDILRAFLNSAWPLVYHEKAKMRLMRIAIDVGYRPDVVKDFIRQCAELNIIPVRGEDSVKARVYRAVKEPAPPGYPVMTRYDLNVNQIKDRLFRLMFESKTPGPGFMHLHGDTDWDVIRQRTSEEKGQVRHRRSGKVTRAWKTKGGDHTANHIWDCDVYAAFAAEISGAGLLPPFEQIKPKIPKKSKSSSGFLDDMPVV